MKETGLVQGRTPLDSLLILVHQNEVLAAVPAAVPVSHIASHHPASLEAAVSIPRMSTALLVSIRLSLGVAALLTQHQDYTCTFK